MPCGCFLCSFSSFFLAKFNAKGGGCRWVWLTVLWKFFTHVQCQCRAEILVFIQAYSSCGLCPEHVLLKTWQYVSTAKTKLRRWWMFYMYCYCFDFYFYNTLIINSVCLCLSVSVLLLWQCSDVYYASCFLSVFWMKNHYTARRVSTVLQFYS